MEKPRIEIRDDYAKYKSLCFDKKVTSVNPVKFTQEKPSRPDYLYHVSPLKHGYRLDLIALMAEQKKLNTSSYKFQIRCEAFCKSPLFRFDSDGSAHQNKNTPLGQQQILTPHFNEYDSEGNGHAYQTDEIIDVSCDDLKDMNRFFGIFCNECNISLDDDSQPVIIPGDSSLLNFDMDNADPLIDINFTV
jgi:hypothetical protein